MKPSSDPPGKKEDRFSHLDEDTCLDLLHGLLPEAEAETALSHMGQCSGCELRFRKIAAERERLRATRKLRRMPGGELAVERSGRESPLSEETEIPKKPLPSLPRRRIGRPRLYLAGGIGAVAALILFFVLSPLREAPSDRNGLHRLPPFSNDLGFRSAVETASGKELLDGLEAYAGRDFGKAADLLGRAKASGSLEMIRKVYLGSAYAWRGESGEAIEILRTVPAEILPDPWGSEARWTLYMAYGKTGAGAAADSLLGLLAEEEGEVGDRARRVRGGNASGP